MGYRLERVRLDSPAMPLTGCSARRHEDRYAPRRSRRLILMEAQVALVLWKHCLRPHRNERSPMTCDIGLRSVSASQPYKGT